MFFLVILILFNFVINANAQTCGNGVIESGEACDPGADGKSYINAQNNDDVLPANIDSCDDLDLSLEGGLGCYGLLDIVSLICQFDVSDCKFKTVDCDDCDDCGWDFLGLRCDQNICVNFCTTSGNCHYNATKLINKCEGCAGVISCGGFTNEADCNGDICGLLVRDIICGTLGENNEPITGGCRVVNELGLLCKWDNTKCVPDDSCTWDCGEIYGNCQPDGFKYQISNKCKLIGVCPTNQQSCVIGFDCAPDVQCEPKKPNVVCNDPSINYPNKIPCNLFEKNFSVFTRFNLIISLIMIISYYTIRNFKNNKRLLNYRKKR